MNLLYAAAMSEANKLIVKKWFEQVWNQKDESAIDRMFSPQGKAHGFADDAGPLVGPEAYKVPYRTFCAAFPDIHFDIEDIVTEGEMAAVRWRATMTHQGNQLGFPASGKRAELTGSSFLRIEGDWIMEGWNYTDVQGLFLRLQTP
jgi:predicted ester cyclase